MFGADDLTADEAGQLLDRWCSRVQRSRLEPFVKAGRTIRAHRDGILAAIRLSLSNGRVEGPNAESDSSSAAHSGSTPHRPPSPGHADLRPRHPHPPLANPNVSTPTLMPGDPQIAWQHCLPDNQLAAAASRFDDLVFGNDDEEGDPDEMA